MSRKRHKYSKKQAHKNSRTPHKRSRKIKINKKQKNYHNKIMKIIKQYFPKKSFTITTAIEKNEIHFFIKNCLALKFEADNIYIDRLDKCSDSGTILLSKIKDAAPPIEKLSEQASLIPRYGIVAFNVKLPEPKLEKLVS